MDDDEELTRTVVSGFCVIKNSTMRLGLTVNRHPIIKAARMRMQEVKSYRC